MSNDLSKFLKRRYKKRVILNRFEEPWKADDGEQYYSDIDYEHWGRRNLKQSYERYLAQVEDRMSPDKWIRAPWVDYSDEYHRVWFRHWDGEERKPKTAWWSGQVHADNIHLQLKCPYKDCGTILDADVLLEGYISPEGYHNGSCVECTDCERHYWVVLEGWDDFRKKVKAEHRRSNREPTPA